MSEFRSWPCTSRRTYGPKNMIADLQQMISQVSGVRGCIQGAYPPKGQSSATAAEFRTAILGLARLGVVIADALWHVAVERRALDSFSRVRKEYLSSDEPALHDFVHHLRFDATAVGAAREGLTKNTATAAELLEGVCLATTSG